MKKILLVEDNQQLQNLYVTALKSAGHDVHSATTVDAALSFLQTNVPDIALLDIILPGGKNGFDLLEHFKRVEALKSVPVVMLTSLDSEQGVALEIGAQEYIVKTETSIQEIVEKVNQLLNI